MSEHFSPYADYAKQQFTKAKEAIKHIPETKTYAFAKEQIQKPEVQKALATFAGGLLGLAAKKYIPTEWHDKAKDLMQKATQAKSFTHPDMVKYGLNLAEKIIPTNHTKLNLPGLAHAAIGMDSSGDALNPLQRVEKAVESFSPQGKTIFDHAKTLYTPLADGFKDKVSSP